MTAKAKNSPESHWNGVWAITMCVFALVASEFMPVSLLSPISQDLGISEGMAGQGIAISGALAVLTSLLISRLAGKLNRKVLLLGMTILMAVSGAVIALAPNYLTYMFGRALIGVAIGGFWSMSAAVAIRLVPQNRIPRALTIFNGGNALATVIAAPLGSYLGSLVGWRGAFFCLVPVAMVAFIWQWISLPSMTVDNSGKPTGNALHLLKNRLIVIGMMACGLFFMGQFALFTYVRPFLETVTRVNISTLSLLLLTIGISGFVGTLVIGRFLRMRFYLTLIIIPLVMALITMMLMAFGHSLWAIVPLLSLWGLVATAAPVGWWSWVARTLPDDAEAGGGLMVAVVQLAIALGSTVGGLAFDHMGWQSTFAISGVLLFLASCLALMTSRMENNLAL
ncbi:MFS transporter [Ewingella sp. S1.OA.A_B6]